MGHNQSHIRTGGRREGFNTQLAITDAPSYLEAVKNHLKDQPVLYTRFLDIVKAVENKQ
jgi:histone deacetylase complex regulatory component SIN3